MNKQLFRSILALHGYTQSKLSKEIGMSKNTMSAKVNGASPFSADQIILICKTVGIEDSKTKCDIFL